MLSFDDVDRIRAEADRLGDFRDVDPTESLTGIRNALIKNPLLQRYLQHIWPKRNTLPRNTQPWQAQGERLYAAAMATFDDTLFKTATEETHDPHLSASTVGALLFAQVYLWTEEVRLIAHNTPLPRHTVGRSLLPYPSMFWSYETALPMTDAESGDEVGERNWLLLFESRDKRGQKGISLISDMMDAEKKTMKFSLGSLLYGSIYPDDMPYPGVAHNVLSALAFLNTPLVTDTRVPLDRSTRREYAKVARKNNLPIPEWKTLETSVVKLRHPVARAMSNGQEGDGIDWQHRWWVSGHFRAQWYPSTKGHKLIWIQPHIKGPEDKPILQKTYHVVQ